MIDLHAENILETVRDLEVFTKGLTRNDYLNNKNFVVNPVEQNVRRICWNLEKMKEEHPEILENHPEVDWDKLIKIGRLLNEGKFELVWQKVWEIATVQAEGIKNIFMELI